MSNRATPESLAEGRRWERPAGEALIAKRWPGSRLVEHQAFSHIDLGVVRADGLFICGLEVKHRGGAHNAFARTMVLWDKHEAAVFFKKYFNAPTYCLLVFDDRVGILNLEDAPADKKVIARGDREDSEKLYALYALTQITWLDDLLEPIKTRVEAEKAAEAEDDIPGI